jgi:hypothetical protein
MAENDKHFVCSECGYIGRGKLVKKGSATIEKILWWVFLIPGPFYSAWRYFSKYRCCPKCYGDDTLVSLKTPEGQRLFENSVRGQPQFKRY